MALKRWHNILKQKQFGLILLKPRLSTAKALFIEMNKALDFFYEIRLLDSNILQ